MLVNFDQICGVLRLPTCLTDACFILFLLRLPSENVQNELQRSSLINIPRKKETKENQNKKKPVHKAQPPSVPISGLSSIDFDC